MKTLYSVVLYCIIVLYCILLYCIVLYCIVLYCVVLYCIVCFILIFNNSGCSLIQTNMTQFHGLHEAVYMLHKEYVHLFSWNQVLIRYLNCSVFWAVLISSGCEFQIFELNLIITTVKP